MPNAIVINETQPVDEDEKLDSRTNGCEEKLSVFDCSFEIMSVINM